MKRKQPSQKWPIALFTVGVFMAGLDNGIVSAALTTIYNSFHVSPAWGAWIVTLYTLGIAVSVPIIGKLSDNYGRKRLFIIEILLFGVGSLLVALSPNFTFLLVARLIQAIGGGGIFIIGSSHILATLPKDKQGKALGLLGGMHGLSAVVGPNAGAIILHLTGAWEWMFYINIPIALFLIITGLVTIPETKEPSSKSLDITGAMLLSFSIVACMLGITNMDAENLLQSLFSIPILPLILAGVISFFLFIRHEAKLESIGKDPIISPTLLKKQTFRFTLVLGFLSGAFISIIIFIPAFVQQVLQVPAENTGFWLTPLAIASGIGAGIGGMLTDKIGARRTVLIAGLIGLVGFYMFYVYVDGGYMFTLASILSGIGLGFLLGAPLNVLIVEGNKENQYGTSLGTLSLVRQIGLTIFPTLFASFITTGVINIEPALKRVFKENILEFEHVKGGEGYDLIMEEIAQIDDPYLYNQLMGMVADTMRLGYQQIFSTAIVISVIVIVVSVYLQITYKKKKMY